MKPWEQAHAMLLEQAQAMAVTLRSTAADMRAYQHLVAGGECLSCPGLPGCQGRRHPRSPCRVVRHDINVIARRARPRLSVPEKRGKPKSPGRVKRLKLPPQPEKRPRKKWQSKHPKSFFREAGRRGGEATKLAHDPAYFSDIAKLGAQQADPVVRRAHSAKGGLKTQERRRKMAEILLANGLDPGKL